MNHILKTVLSLSFSGSLLILILFVCKYFLKDKISRQWQYYIWLIVVGRLLLPFAPEINLVRNVFQEIDYTIDQINRIQPKQQEQTDLEGVPYIAEINSEETNQEDRGTTETQYNNESVQDSILLLFDNIWLIWIVTALILLIRKITIYQSFVRYVKAGQNSVSDTNRLDQLAIIGQQTGVKKVVELCVNPLISSPLLIGFFHPCIVLPSIDLSEKDFQYIIVHELTHFKRRDMFYKWLVQVTIFLDWFNPFVYIMGREINKACEFSCDEAIISKLASNNVQEYGVTLLHAMQKVGKYKEALVSVTLNENKKILKERLGAIMSFKKKSIIVKAVTVVLTISLCFSATVIGSYAAEYKVSSLGGEKDIWVVGDEEMDELPDKLLKELEKDPYVREALDLGNTENTKDNSVDNKYYNNSTKKEVHNKNTLNTVTSMKSIDGTKISNVVITGKNVGIVIEQSSANKFELEYAGVKDTNNFTFYHTIDAEGTLEVMVSGNSLVNYISADPNNKVNAISMKIPKKTYDSFSVNIEKGALYLPNINGKVTVDSNKSSIKVTANQLQSNLNLNLEKSSLKFSVTKISNNINIIGADTGNSVNIVFRETPKNLKLDAAQCKGSVVLPNGWSKNYRIGTNKPIVKLNVKGNTKITLE